MSVSCTMAGCGGRCGYPGCQPVSDRPVGDKVKQAMRAYTAAGGSRPYTVRWAPDVEDAVELEERIAAMAALHGPPVMELEMKGNITAFGVLFELDNTLPPGTFVVEAR